MDILVSLVPIGSPVLLMRTHALSSNLINPPSLRCISFFALTTTACLMSPLRTLFVMPKLDDPGDSVPKDLCFCTTTMIRSPRLPSDSELEKIHGWNGPIRAACFFFLMTAIHSTMAAPELSMQLSIVYKAVSRGLRRKVGHEIPSIVSSWQHRQLVYQCFT
jgi:hypothetical protein